MELDNQRIAFDHRIVVLRSRYHFTVHYQSLSLPFLSDQRLPLSDSVGRFIIASAGCIAETTSKVSKVLPARGGTDSRLQGSLREALYLWIKKRDETSGDRMLGRENPPPGRLRSTRG